MTVNQAGTITLAILILIDFIGGTPRDTLSIIVVICVGLGYICMLLPKKRFSDD